MKTVSYQNRNRNIPGEKFIRLTSGIISILGNVARSFHSYKIMASLGVILFLLAITTTTQAQENLTQTIRGQIVDKASQSTLPGVNIIIENIEPRKGCISDANGWFTLENVPIGRHTITCSYMGYETVTLQNVLLLSGKQLMLNIAMEERVEELNEVVVKAYKRGETINKMATNSARSFSVEETERYPGSFGDVARMASNFAGVQDARDGGNAIVIRGNSPIGMLWRMEGVDIPNPNHFSYAEMTSGSISMINNNLLSNSDFFTGAFPAEYGNAISGVFDLHLRNGNNQKHEFLGQIGMAGFELGAEGPISKSQGSSYLINYRYSTLGLMYKLGFDFGTGGAVPFYQDVTAKINLPTAKAGKFSMFVLAGISNIDMIDSELDTTEQDDFDIYSEYEQDIYSKTKTGIVGISHQYRLSNTAYTKLIVSTSYHQNKAMLDSLSTETREVIPYHRGTKNLIRSSVRLFYHKKFSAKDNIRIGAIAQSRGFSMLDSTFLGEYNRFHTTMDFEGETWLLQPYVQWKHKFNNRLTSNIGVHGEFLTLNNRYSIEPRAGISYKMRPNQRLSLAYGLHSYMLPMFIYQNKIYHEPSDSYVTPNEDLDFTKSHHLVLGYDYNINATLRFKTELYYQSIYDAAVDVNPGTFSTLNFGTNLYSLPDTLVNGGSGTNYGIELTFQQLMNKGLYYLATVSLYDSKYKGSDNIERNTVFNSNYAVNVVGGKEFLLHKKKEKKSSSIAIDGRVVWSGGYRYAPVDVEKSRQYKMTRYDDSQGYSQQLDDYFRADIRIMFKKNVKGHSEEYGLDIQNITNRKNPLHAKYDSTTNSEKIATLAGIMPMMMFRITF